MSRYLRPVFYDLGQEEPFISFAHQYFSLSKLNSIEILTHVVVKPNQKGCCIMLVVFPIWRGILSYPAEIWLIKVLYYYESISPERPSPDSRFSSIPPPLPSPLLFEMHCCTLSILSFILPSMSSTCFLFIKTNCYFTVFCSFLSFPQSLWIPSRFRDSRTALCRWPLLNFASCWISLFIGIGRRTSPITTIPAASMTGLPHRLPSHC